MSSSEPVAQFFRPVNHASAVFAELAEAFRMNLVVAVARRQHSNLRSPVSSPNAGATGGASANGVRRDHDAAGIARLRSFPQDDMGPASPPGLFPDGASTAL